MTAKLTWSICLLFLASSVLLVRAAGQGNGRSNAGSQSSHAGRTRVTPLRPTSDSDVVLDEILLSQDDMGRRRVIMSGPLENGVRERLFWIADPQSGRYHILRLTGDHGADAKRIQKVHRNFGEEISDQDVADMLQTDSNTQDGRIRELRAKANGQPSRRARLEQRRPEPAEPGYRVVRVANDLAQTQRPPVAVNGQRFGVLRQPASPAADDCAASDEVVRPRLRTVQWVERCAGYGYADVQTWELVRFVTSRVNHLNETWTAAWWNRANSAVYGLYVDGFCWANPSTFVGTHWFTTFCWPHSSSYGTGFDSSWTGQYVNIDFLHQVLQAPYLTPIYVTSTASVQYVNGSPNWGAQYYEDGSYAAQYIESWVLRGEIFGEAYEYGCSWYCEPEPDVLGSCLAGGATRYWDYDICECADSSASPIVIDLQGDGLKLTGPQGGVSFDLRADGQPVRTAWTRAGSLDAFLALDRNHNGTIDDGSELFGNVTPQPVSAKKPSRKKKAPNGFLALSVFDDRTNGGNEDRMITEDDAIYGSLLLWVDANHDGVSQPDELKSLAEYGVRSISLHYIVGKEVDEFGNIYRFRSHVLMDRDIVDNGSIRRRAIDVFFKIMPQ